MTDADGTYAQLVEMTQEGPRPAAKPAKPSPQPKPVSEVKTESAEDLHTTPYISQNYRFTDDELRWLRRQAYNLTERFGTKVTQNTVLRIALHHLQEACVSDPKHNPLVESVSRLRK